MNTPVASPWRERVEDMLLRLKTMQPPNVLLQQITMLGEARDLLTEALASPAPSAGVDGLRPAPCGYVRNTDGEWRFRLGADCPPNRSGGYSTRWTAVYDTPSVDAAIAAAISQHPAAPSVSPAVDDAAVAVGHLNFNSMTQCADSWLAVNNLLHELVPDWTNNSLTGREAALAAIRRLATPEQPGSAVQGEGVLVGWCALNLDRTAIAWFDGKPMVMPGKVGNEHHRVPLYAGTPPAPAAEQETKWLDIPPFLRRNATPEEHAAWKAKRAEQPEGKWATVPAISPNASDDDMLAYLDKLLAVQGQLMFARENCDEEAAEVFGVAILDFMRLYGMRLRAKLASAPAAPVGVDEAAGVFFGRDERGRPVFEITDISGAEPVPGTKFYTTAPSLSAPVVDDAWLETAASSILDAGDSGTWNGRFIGGLPAAIAALLAALGQQGDGNGK